MPPRDQQQHPLLAGEVVVNTASSPAAQFSRSRPRSRTKRRRWRAVRHRMAPLHPWFRTLRIFYERGCGGRSTMLPGLAAEDARAPPSRWMRAPGPTGTRRRPCRSSAKLDAARAAAARATSSCTNQRRGRLSGAPSGQQESALDLPSKHSLRLVAGMRRYRPRRRAQPLACRNGHALLGGACRGRDSVRSRPTGCPSRGARTQAPPGRQVLDDSERPGRGCRSGSQ